MVVECSDDRGSTWLTVTGTENGLEQEPARPTSATSGDPAEQQQARMTDRESPADRARLYRAYSIGELGETAPQILAAEGLPYQVRALEYRVLNVASPIRLADSITEQEFELPGFRCRVSGRTLAAEPADEWTDMVRCRAAFDAQAARWALTSEIVHQLRFSLQFWRCWTTDGSCQWQMVVSEPSQPKGIDLRTEVDRLPTEALPVNESEAVRRARERLTRAQLWREPLPTAAYALHTLIGDALEGDAPKRLRVSKEVWRRISRLAVANDSRDWRKVQRGQEAQLTSADRAWLWAALRQVVARFALVEAGIEPDNYLTAETVLGATPSVSDLLGQVASSHPDTARLAENSGRRRDD